MGKQDTLNYCNLFPLPSFSSPVHLIRYETLLKNENIYSIMLYECNDGFIPSGPYSKECGSVDVPFDIANNCLNKLLNVWGSGGSRVFNYPKEAGYRLNKGLKYVLMKIHYKNMDTLKEVLNDNSGMKLSFTETLRNNDIGMLMVGVSDVQLSLQIPPGANSIKFSTSCHPECTQKFIPSTGVTIISTLSQLYKTVKSSKVTIARENNGIANLLNEQNYDARKQFYYDAEPIKILKVYHKPKLKK